jgi:2-polyprenyl-3-methyl-5-hydroxy-6-metoxy-1,4-benzoquinol methylase
MSRVDWEAIEQDKFKSKHPLVKLMNRFFLKILLKKIKEIKPESILDVGCGEGTVSAQILKQYKAKYFGTDLSHNMLKQAKNIIPVFRSDIYNLPVKKKSVDLVICLEVLEHLEKPDTALKNIRRASNNAILAVPFQKLMSLGNITRGKHIKTWGRFPDHINSWNYFSFKSLLKRHFKKVDIRHAGVWLIATVSDQRIKR